MQARRTLVPGQRGAKKYLDHYGEKLICVRYRYDEQQRQRVTTVEIEVKESAWTLPAAPSVEPVIVGLRVGLNEVAIQWLVKQAGRKWNCQLQVWEISSEQAVVLGLTDRIQKLEVSSISHQPMADNRQPQVSTNRHRCLLVDTSSAVEFMLGEKSQPMKGRKMRRILISCLILLLSATLVQGQTRTTKAKVGGNEKVKEEIGNILLEMSEALLKKDQKVCERYLAPSYHAVDTGGGIIPRAIVMQGIEQGLMLPADMTVKWTFEDLEVFVDGNSAVAIYRYDFEMYGPQIRAWNRLRVSTYFVRNGKSWQILAEHRSYPEDLIPTEKVDPKSFEAFIGEYQAEEGLKAVVTREGDRLYCQKGSFTKLELIPGESSIKLKEELKEKGLVSSFFKVKDGGRVSYFIFKDDNEGKVTGVVIYNSYPLLDNTIFVGKKIK